MTNLPRTPEDLARALCGALHPHRQPIPCGEHILIATRAWGMVVEPGQPTFLALAAAAGVRTSGSEEARLAHLTAAAEELILEAITGTSHDWLTRVEQWLGEAGVAVPASLDEAIEATFPAEPDVDPVLP